MGKYFTNIIIIFLLSTSVCSQENQDIVPYNLKAALKSVLNNHKTIAIKTAPLILHSKLIFFNVFNGSRRDRVAAVAVMWGFW